MLTIEAALDAVLGCCARPLPAATMPLADAVGCVLDEDVAADIDLPPFDKAIVDGFAVRSADLAQIDALVRLRLGEWIAAGMDPTQRLGPGEAATIMTGAPVPPGCDAVVMHEHTRTAQPSLVEFSRAVRPGQNIMTRGREMRAGDVAVPRGTVLNPAWLGVLASVGRVHVSVIPPAQLAIVPTGDELVEPGQPLGPGQIRNSNAIMLEAMARSSRALARTLPIAPDDPIRLRAILEQGLSADVLIVAGGVSAGDRDFVPATLLDLGVQPVFHKVKVKPGKPIWFGVGPDRGTRRPALVFGLPGNPVSGLVGFVLFVAPALTALAGLPAASVRRSPARLTRPFVHRGERTTFYPARLREPVGDEEGDNTRNFDRLPRIETLDWAGSADLRTVAAADGFAVFPGGDRDYEPGEIVGFHPLR